MTVNVVNIIKIENCKMITVWLWFKILLFFP